MSARWLHAGSALLLALAVACGGGPSGPPVRYVALGDSYASGEGNPPYEQGTDVAGNRCHRSAAAYPNQVRVKNPVALEHRACSGAVVADLLSQSRYGEAPQVQALNPAVQVVTVTIGGNDAGFTVIELCLVPRAPCSAAEPVLLAKIAQLGERLPPLYAEIRRRAPRARVLVVGYPQLFPDPATVPIDGCRMLNYGGRGIDSADVLWLRRIGGELNGVIATAARQAGVEFVDETRAVAGHEVCTPMPWIYGALPFDRKAFHPAPAGQKAMAARVAEVITHPPTG